MNRDVCEHYVPVDLPCVECSPDAVLAIIAADLDAECSACGGALDGNVCPACEPTTSTKEVRDGE